MPVYRRATVVEIKESARDLLQGHVSFRQRCNASANMLIAWLYAYVPYEWAADHDRKLAAIERNRW